MTPFLGHTVHLTPPFPFSVSSHTSFHLRTQLIAETWWRHFQEIQFGFVFFQFIHLHSSSATLCHTLPFFCEELSVPEDEINYCFEKTWTRIMMELLGILFFFGTYFCGPYFFIQGI